MSEGKRTSIETIAYHCVMDAAGASEHLLLRLHVIRLATAAAAAAQLSRRQISGAIVVHRWIGGRLLLLLLLSGVLEQQLLGGVRRTAVDRLLLLLLVQLGSLGLGLVVQRLERFAGARLAQLKAIGTIVLDFSCAYACNM